MKRIFVVLVLLNLFAAGCGGGNGGASLPVEKITSGNWSFDTSTNPTFGHLDSMGGSFVLTGSSLSGTMFVDLTTCSTAPAVIDLSGTMSGNSFTLKASPLDNQVITIQGTIQGPNSLSGTYSISGGCANGEQGSIAGVYVPPLTGTWKTTESVNGTPVTITLKLTQAPNATSTGYFPLSGTATYSGSPCATTGTVDQNVSFVLGKLVGVFVSTNESGGTGTVLYGGALDAPATATSFQGFEEVMTGSCSSSGALLMFSKQPSN